MRVWKRLSAQALACGAALAIAAPAVPQAQGQGQGQNPPTIKTEVSLVNLFATVRDKNKRVVTDLKQENFKISEDGHDEKIAFFSREMMLPITLGRFSTLYIRLDQTLLLQFSQQRIETPITDPGIWANHIIDDLGDEIAMDRPAHQQ